MVELMAHQRRALEIARTKNRYGFFFDPGTGKTIAALSILDDEKRRTGRCAKTVAVAPKSIMQTAWLDDAAKFGNIRAVCCWARTPSERRKLIGTDADLYVINPEGFKRHADDLMKAGVERLFYDESSGLKNHDSQITKHTIQVADNLQSVFMLSGTPAPNNDTEYWGQLRAIQKGIISDSFYRFAYKYFSPIKQQVRDRSVIAGWKPIPDKRQEFLDLLASCSWTLRKQDCLDLPPQTDEVRIVELDDDEKYIYAATESQLVKEWETTGGRLNLETNNVMMKLRQVTGGGLYQDGVYRGFSESKLDELRDTLDELGSRQCVIFAVFTGEIDRIHHNLNHPSGRCAIIDGRQPLDARNRNISAFQRGEIQYLVCHPQAAGHGITLTAANYMIFFSLAFSFELYQQARDRIHRHGQNWPCTYIHLLAKGTIDEKVYWAVKNKKAASEVLKAILAQHGKEAHVPATDICDVPF